MRSSLRLAAGALGLALICSVAPSRPVAAAGEPYVIGAILSESGPGATLGRPEADSMQLAVDDINKAGGIAGRQIKLTILDDQSDATTAVNDFRKLEDDHPIAIFGTPLTPTSLALVDEAQKAQIPLVSFASSASVVTPVDQHKWIFKIPINDTEVAKAMQAYMKKHGQTKVSFIYRNDDYGKTGRAHFLEAGKAEGFTEVSSDAIDATAGDATTQLTHVKAANPQALICWTTLPSANVILRGFRELGLTMPLYYSDGAATGVFPKQAGPAIDGTYIATMKVNVADQLPEGDPTKRPLDHYIAAFDAGYPKDAPVSIFGTWGYDGVGFLKAALEKLNGKNVTAATLRDQFEHTTFVGVSGTFRFSPSQHYGLSESDVLVSQIQHGKFTIVH
ncbi:MAG TPA: ABC transporter substrate-binding protein [Candidatus Sulfotelmatobacter sp.]|nr:ABC transporter substrate-binding protein [Candidatus Sulfotelmatobacter sp.]